MANSFHIPVLTKEILNYLNLKKGGVYIDCTLGGGGHSKAILEKIYPHGLLIGIDQDIEAIETAKEELKGYIDKVELFKGNFKNLEEILSDLKTKTVSGIIFDLGVSFHQLQAKERGFSFKEDSHLDMRMDLNQEFNADILINSYSEKDLAEIFEKYGEERFSKRIVRLIAIERKKKTITTTKQLADLVIRSLPRTKKRHTWRIHPATRVFQAIRIEVNQELKALEKGLNQAIRVLEDKGRICVISYHSLEDRIVKHLFKEAEREGKEQKNYGLKIVTKKPIRPSLEEVRDNLKARSAKLRVAEKIISVF
ncbi:16S rRNA (cytosine(1402)-N(4))-methyltransferase [Candidatus Atribacteria bacterium RBG_19FT_COMBO_35_14]|uniref:Ribosomal RNA small subunit methyltransferase H n=1 Tax=Candidatus Sediminicultor quintus TaxID=1797291 RepID=A0A1F5ADE1_9BACT|nr:MAG: 16S rRNA (cytosine(1402)-N(4))-methyltransferase [Candidatus Atribacteria bacterium RBG_19FT_COMBO_35_14]